jgi:hypothetical protein
MATEPLVQPDGCVCKDWEETMPKLNGPIVLASIRAGNPKLYTGTPFRFCPWCGANLAELRKLTG